MIQGKKIITFSPQFYCPNNKAFGERGGPFCSRKEIKSPAVSTGWLFAHQRTCGECGGPFCSPDNFQPYVVSRTPHIAYGMMQNGINSSTSSFRRQVAAAAETRSLIKPKKPAKNFFLVGLIRNTLFHFIFRRDVCKSPYGSWRIPQSS